MRATPEQIALAEARVGKQLEGFLLERLLGAGELGAVYRARSPKGTDVALKLAHAELARAFATELADSMRVANEVGHPRAPSVLDALEIDGTPAVVSELVSGENVAHLIRRRRGMIPPAEALRIAGDALEVVLTAHARGIAHGSLSPAHLISADDGSIHVLGFGEAKLRRVAKVESRHDYAPPDSGSLPSASNDLWAIGAILFPLLVGENAFSGGKPRRLGEIARDAPKPLEDLVERAIAVDPSRRFRDAPTLLAGIRTAAQLREICYLHSLRRSLPPPPPGASLSVHLPITEPPNTPVSRTAPTAPPEATLTKSDPELRVGAPFEPSRVTSPPALQTVEPPPQHATPKPMNLEIVRADTLPALPLIELAPPSARRRREADLVLGITTSDAEESSSLESVFDALSRTLHDETSLADFEAVVTRALGAHPGGLACKITGNAFATEVGRVSPAGLDAIVERLDAAGVQTLALLAGIDGTELDRLVDTFRQIAKTTVDPVNLLFDADFEHVIFVAPDPLAGIREPLRIGLDSARRRLNVLVSFDSSDELEEAWHRSRHARRAVRGVLDQTLEYVSESVVLAGPLPTAAGHLLETESAIDAHRLAEVAASSFEGPAFGPALQAFGPRLRHHVETMAVTEPEKALALVVSLVDSLRVPENQLEARRADLVDAVITPTSVKALISAKTAQTRSGFELVERVLPWLGARYAKALAETLTALADAKLHTRILHHLEFGVTGHESELGMLAAQSDPRTAIGLVRLLARIDTLAAKNAISEATRNPNPIVRIEALGLREGASSAALRGELRARLEAAKPADRAKTLRAIVDYEIRVATPFLALRARGKDFDELPFEEKRLVLRGLAALAPARAEKIATQMLGEQRLLNRDLHEESRELAAETLGDVASSEDSIFVLEEHSRRRWGSSERVREAAERSLTQARARMASAKRPSRGPR